MRATRVGDGVRLGCTHCQCFRDIPHASFPVMADLINSFLATHGTCTSTRLRDLMLTPR